MVGVKGINGKTLDHPSNLLDVRAGRCGANTKPRGKRVAVRHVPVYRRVRLPFPEFRPRRAAVRATEDVRIGVPLVKRSDHDCAGLLQVDGETAEAEVQIAAGDGGDVGDDAGGDVVLVHGAERAVVRASTVGGRDVERLLRRGEDALVGHPGGVGTSDGGESRATVVGHEKVGRSGGRNADEDTGSGCAR